VRPKADLKARVKCGWSANPASYAPFGATVQRFLQNPRRLRIFNVAMGALLALSIALILA
jgi:hypothetical protein